MTLNTRTTLIAGAVAALLAGPVWAASDTSKDGAQTSVPTKAEVGQTGRDQPSAAQPMSETPRMGGTTDGEATTGTSIGDNPLFTRSADDLDGMDVIDRAGDKVGTVKQIVLSPDRKSAHAVISAGGILGIGARDLMVSLDELKPLDDKLQMSVTEEEIAARKDEAPDSDEYAEVTGDAPISESIVEFSAFEPGAENPWPTATPMAPGADADRPAAAPETHGKPQ